MAHCDSYYPGQCTAGACQLNSWIPDGLGNGGQWAAKAAARGYVVTMTPTAPSVVCYCAGDGYSEFGHVATVLSLNGDGTFVVREENYLGPFLWDTRTSSTYDVCGFILPPGASPGQNAPSSQGQGSGPAAGAGRSEVEGSWQGFGDVVNQYIPNVNQYMQWVQSNITGWVGWGF